MLYSINNVALFFTIGKRVCDVAAGPIYEEDTEMKKVNLLDAGGFTGPHGQLNDEILCSRSNGKVYKTSYYDKKKDMLYMLQTTVKDIHLVLGALSFFGLGLLCERLHEESEDDSELLVSWGGEKSALVTRTRRDSDTDMCFHFAQTN